MRADEQLKLRLMGLLSSKRGEFFTLPELAEMLGRPRLMVSWAIRDLLRSKKLKKHDDYYGLEG